jgi:hypothetical protein
MNKGDFYEKLLLLVGHTVISRAECLASPPLESIKHWSL